MTTKNIEEQKKYEYWLYQTNPLRRSRMIRMTERGISPKDLYEMKEEELKKLAEQYKMELDKIKEMVDVEAVKSDLKGRKAVKLIVDNAKPVEKEKEKKAAKKSAKKEDEAAEAPAEEAPKAEE
jgi:hypothetical protein